MPALRWIHDDSQPNGWLTRASGYCMPALHWIRGHTRSCTMALNWFPYCQMVHECFKCLWPSKCTLVNGSAGYNMIWARHGVGCGLMKMDHIQILSFNYPLDCHSGDKAPNLCLDFDPASLQTHWISFFFCILLQSWNVFPCPHFPTTILLFLLFFLWENTKRVSRCCVFTLC